MADLHSHILPGVDDGASTLNDGLNMLWKAVECGVTIQVLTPHIDQCRYKNTRNSLELRYWEFYDMVEEAKIPIELHLAAEIRICNEIMQMVDDDKIPWLGYCNGEKSFLLEFPQNSIPLGSINLIQWLRKERILPVIAHPERNLVFQKHPSRLKPFLDAGCPLQVTSRSITGGFGKMAQKLAFDLLKKNLVKVIATDCHNLKYRQPDLCQGVKIASKVIGKPAVTDMVTRNVFDLISGDTKRVTTFPEILSELNDFTILEQFI
jgi:protein-tyrosine phosphatase